jgi:hypothetical protein
MSDQKTNTGNTNTNTQRGFLGRSMDSVTNFANEHPYGSAFVVGTASALAAPAVGKAASSAFNALRGAFVHEAQTQTKDTTKEIARGAFGGLVKSAFFGK